MKASQLITALQKAIAHHGDLPLVNGNNEPLENVDSQFLKNKKCAFELNFLSDAELKEQAGELGRNVEFHRDVVLRGDDYIPS